jgi:glycosyltransferase involved in cell wall biosynthesis
MGRPKVACLATVDMSIRFLLLRQLQYLQAAGYDVIAVCKDGPYVNQIIESGIPVKTFSMSRRVTSVEDVVALRKLTHMLRDQRFDIVHTHTPKAGLLGRIAGKLAGVPHIVHTDFGLYFLNMDPVRRRLFIWLERLAGRCCDVMLFEDNQALTYAIHEKLCRRDQAHWIGGGINLKEFNRGRFSEADIQAKRLELGLPLRSVVVGIVARLVREKGYCEFFNAAQMILKVKPDTRFLVVGPDDPEKHDAITPAWVQERYGLSKEIVFAGVQYEMPITYAAMDVFTLPTHRDSWPRSPMEAAAMGLPAVVSNLPGVAPMVEQGKTGYAVPVGDSARLASAVLEIIGNRDSAREMGDNARHFAETRYDEQKVFQRVEDIYGSILGGTESISLPSGPNIV